MRQSRSHLTPAEHRGYTLLMSPSEDERAKLRRECWDQVMRGFKSIMTGAQQIVMAIAKYQCGTAFGQTTTE